MSEIAFENDDNITYRFVDWGQWGSLTYGLAKKILENEKSFDRIIALATGGLTLSRAMKDYLNIPKLSSIHISFYTGIGTKGKQPVITESLGSDIQGEHILVFDDINDSGGTLKVAKEYLAMRGASSIVTATIFQKPVTSLPSDYHVEDTDYWIIMPDEVRETITVLTKKWQGQQLSSEDITSRLIKIGFEHKHIDLITKNP